ncbi:MAG: hypothetical protein MUO31_15855, partial [Thermodesulfovibrionales bacterium]|nr:hypothetical protein [Thermodesulfovibrionales bacterium]
KDPRGIIYCRLGLGEIAFLTGDRTRAEKYLVSARKALAKHHFAVEDCHAKTLHSIMNRQRATMLSFAQREIGESTREGIPRESCYQRLGLNLRFHSLPLNIP